MIDDLRDRIAAVLYIESSEAEDGDVVWESPEAIAEEVESWDRFADAVIADLGLVVEATVRVVDHGAGEVRIPESRVVGKWER